MPFKSQRGGKLRGSYGEKRGHMNPFVFTTPPNPSVFENGAAGVSRKFLGGGGRQSVGERCLLIHGPLGLRQLGLCEPCITRWEKKRVIQVHHSFDQGRGRPSARDIDAR